MKKNYIAFTMAEVLITLGLIGVVAAMTLPALLADYRRLEGTVRIKKFVSTMQQAFNTATVNYGDAINWKFPTVQNDKEQINEFVDTYLFPYLTGIKQCAADAPECREFAKHLLQGQPVYIFSDGSCFGMTTGGAGETVANIHFMYDYNCMGKPNKYGYDIFQFVMQFSAGKAPKFRGGGTRLLNATNREELLELCKNPDSEYQKSDCATLIEYDGWEIKEDYPWY